MNFPTNSPISLPPAGQRKPLESALCPRDKDGLIVPLIPVGPSDYAKALGTVYYPVITPDSEGLKTPMLFDSDFANGQYPENFGYAPGYAHPTKFSAGNALNGVVYDDPYLNLAARDQHLLRLAQTAAPQLLNISEDSHTPSVIVSSNGESLLMVDNQMSPLANFSLKVVECQRIIVRGEEDINMVVLNIVCDGSSKELSIRTTDLDNLVSIVTKKFPSCHLDIDANKASARLVNFVRDQLKFAPSHTIIRSSGFIRLPSGWIYAHDGAVSPTPNISFETNCTIFRSPGTSPGTAMKQALEVLNLSDRKDLTLPLFLLGHLGLTFELFVAAGYQPKFVTFLNGSTGSFKTAVATCLFRTFLESPTTAEASFRDTPTALEVGLGAAYSRVFLLDDYQPALTSATQRAMLDKLEFVIRLVGDGIGKNRSNAELGRAKVFKPVGCCLITGEDLGGSRSSLLRCLVLPISKGDISGEQLKVFQDHPEILWDHYSCFVDWVGQNGDALISYIKANFQDRRSYYRQFLREPRQVDIAVTLTLVGGILLQYAVYVGLLHHEEVFSTAENWGAFILDALLTSEESSRTLSPIVMFLQAIFNLHGTHKLLIAPNQSVYQAGHHTGYAKDDCWWLFPHDVFSQVRRYWKDCGKIFPLEEAPLFQLLREAELIETETENRGGKKKTLCLKRSSLPDRPRLLVLHIDRARDYLEKMENE